ncbi:MAG TPA: acetate/propionate family kinase [Alphaproteobacteria bacterium]|nr:acetate/propionate family kinase [Alphaproteobacteria bacterium]
MADFVLVLNAGSSSIKFSVFKAEVPDPACELNGQIEGLYASAHFIARDAKKNLLDEKRWPEGEKVGHDVGLAYLTQFLRNYRGERRVLAVGHRVVHGGAEHSRPALIDKTLVAQLEKLSPLAPLHQPHNLAAIKSLLELAPQIPQVACFDTAFHRTHPEVAQAYALPPEITMRGVRRYGFHGLSYEYIASVLPKIDPRSAAGRVVVAHLGNGASMCAIHAGRSIASTMGFTAIEGLPMGTRCGNLDPGVILFLMDELGMDARGIEKLLYTRSGLLGVSGVSSDMRALEASTEPRARAAIDLFVYRIGRELGSLVAALGGLDAIVFTAGIGENSVAVRSRVCGDAQWIGVKLDATANERHGPLISVSESPVRAWVIPTNEELMIARHTLQLVGAA